MKLGTVNIDKAVLQKCRIHCAIVDSPMGDWVEVAITEKMERDK